MARDLHRGGGRLNVAQPRKLSALVVDDEPSLVRVVEGYLLQDGFSVRTAGDGETALALARESEPDLIVLDLGLPGMDGIEMCHELRTFSRCHILMLPARADEVDMLIGLGVGADDYVTKPFSPRTLMARVRTRLRRPRSGGTEATETAEQAHLVFGDLVIDLAAHEARVGAALVPLTRLEFDLLETLSSRPPHGVHQAAAAGRRLGGRNRGSQRRAPRRHPCGPPAIARTITGAHHGTLTGHSDGPGQGARFTMTLPVGAKRSRRRPATG